MDHDERRRTTLSTELRTRGLSVQQLAAEVTRRMETMEDFISDTRRMGFDVDESKPGADGETPAALGRVTLTLDGEQELIEFPVNDYCQQQMAGRLGIPFRFWERMRDDHPDILKDAVGKLLVREPEVRMVRTLDGYARAFLSNRYRRLDYYELLDLAVLPALGEDEGMEVFSCALTDRKLYMKVIFPDVKFEVKPGDEVSGGIVIGNSEVGSGSLSVEPFTYRWACSNGCIMGQKSYSDFGLRKYHVGKAIEDTSEARAIFSDETLRKEDEAFFAMAYDLVKNSRNGIHFAAIAARMQELAGIKVGGDPVLAVERLAKTHGFSENERGSIMQHLVEGGDLSAWGYVNAITRAAQDVPDYDRSTDLERTAGDLHDLSTARWRALAAA
jgi:hypothetical protein